MSLVKKLTLPNFLYLFSLLFIVTVFYLVRHFMIHLDEFDNIVSPYLMVQGKKFYTDLFNMQFPLSFYWARLFAPFWVAAAPVRALAIFRLSLVTFYLLTSLLVFTSFKNPKVKITYSVWFLLFGILAPLYHGNLYVSETFNTVSLVSLFWLVLPVALNLEKYTDRHLYLSILFVSLSFWSQPLLIVLALIPFFILPRNRILHYLIFSFVFNLFPLIYFLVNGQLVDFFQQTVFFNVSTYSNFFPEQVNNQNMFVQGFFTFLNNQDFILTHLGTPTQVFQFFAQLSFLILFLILLFRRRYSALVVLALFFLTVHLREIKIVPGRIYIFAIFPYLAIASASAFFLFLLKPFRIPAALLVVILFVTAAADFAPILKQSLVPGRNYDEFWSYRQRIGEDIARLTQPGDPIMVYPYESDLYFFSRRTPFDRFIYWFPWLASNPEFSRQRAAAFSNNPPRLIYYRPTAFNGDSLGYYRLWPDLLTGYRQLYHDCQPTNYWLPDNFTTSLPPGFTYDCPSP